MTTIILTGTVLLISQNPEIRHHIRLERSPIDPNTSTPVPALYGGAPLTCVSDLEAGFSYLERFSDVDTVYIDSALLTEETIRDFLRRLESMGYDRAATTKLVLLCTRRQELHRVKPPQSFVFRQLNLQSAPKETNPTNLRL